MAAGVELPRSFIAHGMWVDPNDEKCRDAWQRDRLGVLKQHFPVDAVRYFCLREMYLDKTVALVTKHLLIGPTATSPAAWVIFQVGH